MEDKLHEEHVKRAKLTMEKEYHIGLVKALNMQIEYIKEHMNDFEEKIKWH